MSERRRTNHDIGHEPTSREPGDAGTGWLLASVLAALRAKRRETPPFCRRVHFYLLSSELGTYLSGRYVPIEVYPFSFSEFVEAYGSHPDKAGLLDYLRRGGLPELIKALGYQVHVGQSRNLKIDFVLERADERIYASICYLLAEESIVEREYRGLESIRDNYPKRVISMDDVGFGTRNGIEHCLAWEVLSDPQQGTA